MCFTCGAASSGVLFARTITLASLCQHTRTQHIEHKYTRAHIIMCAACTHTMPMYEPFAWLCGCAPTQPCMTHVCIDNGVIGWTLPPLTSTGPCGFADNNLGYLDAVSMQALCAGLSKLTALQNINLGGECNCCMFFLCSCVCCVWGDEQSIAKLCFHRICFTLV